MMKLKQYQSEGNGFRHALSWLSIYGTLILGGACVMSCSSEGTDTTVPNGGDSDTLGASDADQQDSGLLTSEEDAESPYLDPDANKEPEGCKFMDNIDHDGDGYSFEQGDCNDCDPNMNPGAFDVIGGVDGADGVDEDCNGVVDDEPVDCDIGIAINDVDPFAAARAIGLCRRVDPGATGKDRTWGVLSARYVKVDGTEGMNSLSAGILPKFGVANVQAGSTMLALSSGTARAPGDPEYQSSSGAGMNTRSNPPAGYPKESPACPGVKTGDVFDPAALELVIRAPTNAKSFSFNLNFYTWEFPAYICSQFNDFYVTMLSPQVPGLPDGNISFDQDGNPISVNNSLLQVCNSRQAGGKSFPCPLGPSLLSHTGFEDHAATGWLKTSAPIEPGKDITLRFAIWDSGDPVLDSLVLIDNFNWSVEPASSAATEPVPIPK